MGLEKEIVNKGTDIESHTDVTKLFVNPQFLEVLITVAHPGPVWL